MPVAVKVWVGFRSVEVAPSPKFHCQEVASPEMVLWKWIGVPVLVSSPSAV